ncbi:hypothetical protein G6F61_002202 [Rhizopus arrhizus]|nr:hypothetical protein G6F32_000809 [Rhizopus arrhizus]KAG1297667.1 hypothetical protein G6F66_002402 [Rhizopus arrhizus]KAG1382503.1 hypothetical protein G6F61_002202 [Rhizopus arrhizus]
MKDNSVPLELNTGQGANRFKYQSFKSRVDRIKVDVVRRSRLVEDEPDEHGSFFYEALESWKDLNMTRHFKNFIREISPLVKSLPSIIHHKDTIVDILEKHLKVKDSMAYDGLLDLVTKLAKDLEGEFYPYYPRLLSCILPLVYHRDIKLLEVCFSFLLAKLLGEDNQGKPYVRKFTAEAFAFLLRKTRGAELTKIVECILNSLKEVPSKEYEEGLAMLFFEAIKQIDHRIHSRGEAIYKELLIQSYKTDVTVEDLATSPIHNLLTKTTLLTLHHTLRQHFTPIINIVIKENQDQLKSKDLDQKALAIHLSLLTMFVTVRKASRVEDFKPLVAQLQELSKTIFASSKKYPRYIYTECLRTIVGTLHNGSLETIVSGGRVILESVSSFNDVELVYGFYLSLAKLGWGNFVQIALPYVIKYTSAHFDTSTQETILFWSEIISTDVIGSNNAGSLASSFTAKGLLRFPSAKGQTSLPQGLMNIMNQSFDWEKERNALNATDMDADDCNISAITILASILHLVPVIEIPLDKVSQILISLLGSLKDFLKKDTANNVLVDAPYVLAHKNFVLECLLGLILEALAGIAEHDSNVLTQMKNIHEELINDILLVYSTNEVVLSGIYRYLDLLYSGNQNNDMFSLEALQKLYPVLKLNFSSYKHQCRLNAFKIIALFDQPVLKQDENHKTDEPCDIASMAVQLEEIEVSFKDYREKIKLMQKLNLVLSSSRVPDIYTDFIPRLALGVLTINLRPLWEEAKRMLTTFAQINSAMYWDIIHGELIKYNDEKELALDTVSKSVSAKLTDPDEPEETNATKIGNLSFDCPTLTRFLHIEDRAWSIMSREKAQSLALLFSKFSQQEGGHVDFWNYYNMLLSVLKETNIITESKGRFLVVMFIDFFNNEFVHSDSEEDDNEEKKAADHESSMEQDKIEILPRSSRITKNKMVSWLSLFSVFTNTKSAYRNQDLYNIFMRIITMGDAKLQIAALECVFTWKNNSIKPYADNLRNLMDDVKFRDELASLIQNEEQTQIDPAHRNQLMPVIMRILFGRLVQKSKASNKISKSSRRKAILSAISCCQINEIRSFIDLTLEPFQAVVETPYTKNEGNTQFEFDEQTGRLLENIPWRKQTGFLNLLEDIIKQMASHVLPFLPDLLKVVLYIINFAHSHTEDSMDIDQGNAEVSQSAKSKEVKNMAMKRIVEMFKINGDFDFTPYVSAMFSAFITSRVATLPLDSTQDISPLVNLFTVWSKKIEYAHYLADFNKDVVPQIITTLGAKTLGAPVHHALLEIIESILDLCDIEMETDAGQSLKEKVVVAHVDMLLQSLQYRLTHSKGDSKQNSGRYTVREISVAARVAPYTQNGAQAATLIQLLLPNLKKPSSKVPEKSKQDIYTIWSKLIRIVPDFEVGSFLYREYYSTASTMFATAYSRESRIGLVQVFHAIAEINPHLVTVDKLLTKLNSYSTRRIDEQDIDSMLEALNSISEEYYSVLDSDQWLPILHQLTHCMHNPEEMAIRGTATHCMTLFLKAVEEQADENEKQKLLGHVQHLLYPAIKRGLRSRVELVRMEFTSLLNSCIKSLPELSAFEDLVQVVGAGDEEINFFNNIYHVQTHRRSRALLRLAEQAQKSTFKVSTINHIFIPIITAFFNESDRVVDNSLLQQCTLTLSALVRLLPWNHYYRILQNYLKLVKTTEEKEKLYVRVIVGILDSFHFDLKGLDLSDEDVQKVMGRQRVRIEYLTEEKINEAARANEKQVTESKVKVEEQEEQEEEETIDTELEKEKQARESLEKIHGILVEKVLPELNALLNTNDSRKSVLVRVPLALGIAKLLCNLPEKSKRVNLPGLLTSVCHIMRSRAQDIRDITRETLIKLSAFLGPSYFNFFITELKAALTKGYELHVLGYTINSLLLDMAPRLNVGDLDYCLKQLTSVLINDIFGGIGEEKDADEMTGKTKEAKSRRSPASFEQISKIIQFKNVGMLLVPLKEVMSETENSRTLRKVDDLLRRISQGLVSNPGFESLELLDFTYGLISENIEDYKATAKAKAVKSQRELNFEVQVKRPTVEPVDYYKANAHRFVYFGLNLFSTALKKISYDLSSSEVNERFKRLVNAIGNTLYTKQSANIVVAARIMAKLITMPIPNIASAVDVSIDRSFALIKAAGGTQTDTIQACLKLLTVCIRDNSRSSLSEAQLTYILNFVRPDMEEVERQGTTFALVRAIISRKFIAPEMYDLMDTVSNIMITNHSKEIREQARSVYFMFLMDYPQGKGRLKKQMSFVIKNLEFEFESGRESIMELLHHIITKFSVEIYSEFVDATFLALVMRLINDDSSKCREMSAALIKSLLTRHSDKLPTVYKLLNTWLDENKKPSLQRAACQVYSLLLDAFGAQVRSQAAILTPRLSAILNASKQRTEELTESYAYDDEDEEDDHMDIDIQWEVTYYAINTFAKLTKALPKLVHDKETESVWSTIQYMLLYPHSWVRSSATRLYGAYFSGVDAETLMVNGTNTKCIYLDKKTLRNLASDFLEQLKSKHVTQEHADQIVKNMFFIGKCFYYMSDEEDMEEVEMNEVAIDDANNETIEEENDNADAQAAAKRIKEDAHKKNLNWLFRKCSFDARGAAIKKFHSSIIMRSSIFKWFAAMCNIMTAEELPPYLMPVIAPIYRTVNDEQNKDPNFASLQQLGNEVLNLLQNKAGPTVYFAVYQRVRQQVLKVREERRSKQALLAVTDPTLAAKRKLDKKKKTLEAKKKRRVRF